MAHRLLLVNFYARTFFAIKAIHYVLIIVCLWLAVACQSPKEEAGPIPKAEATVAIRWMDLFLDIERYAPGYRPPVAARALGYISLAAYETVVPGSAEYQSIAGRLPGLTLPKVESGRSYNWSEAVNETYYVMMKHCFPHVTEADKGRIEQLYRMLKEDKGVADEMAQSRQFGQAVAAAVIAYAKMDIVGDEAYLRNQPTDYTPPTGPGKWQPSYPDYSRALLPYWGKARTFVATESDKLAKPPAAYSTNVTSPMYTQGLEVYSTTTPLAREQQWIGEFWSDDIYKLTFEPAGRWLAIAQQVIKGEKVSLEKAVYTYVKLGIGLNDVAVACWNSKYIYNVERPISYIHRTIDPKWQSRLNNPLTNVQGITPPFPAYPSGHSCFGAVAAEVLTDIFGANHAMTDRCHEGRTEFMGMPRSFNNFYENGNGKRLFPDFTRRSLPYGLRRGAANGVRYWPPGQSTALEKSKRGS